MSLFIDILLFLAGGCLGLFIGALLSGAKISRLQGELNAIKARQRLYSTKTKSVFDTMEALKDVQAAAKKAREETVRLVLGMTNDDGVIKERIGGGDVPDVSN